MKVFYCVRNLEAIPSCMYNIQMLCDYGYDVIPVMGRTTEHLNKYFEKRGLQTFAADNMVKKNKILNYLSLNKNYKKCFNNAMKSYNSDDLIVFGTSDSVITVRRLIKNRNFVICLKELHESPPSTVRKLMKLSDKTKGIICCEKNRAKIIKFRWNLKELPYTLSNKPYGYSTTPFMQPTSSITSSVIKSIKDKTVIVYQARHIHFADELISLSRALKMIGKDIVLVFIGTVDNKDDVQKIESIYSNVIWAGHIPAPLHLEITSYAKIGVAVYAENSLNNLFCAPNKIYEYAGFGIPSLCNDVPGLVETVGMSRAGVCVPWQADEIAKAILDILDNYEEYSKNSKRFFDEEDNVKKLGNIVDEISQRMC